MGFHHQYNWLRNRSSITHYLRRIYKYLQYLHRSCFLHRQHDNLRCLNFLTYRNILRLLWSSNIFHHNHRRQHNLVRLIHQVSNKHFLIQQRHQYLGYHRVKPIMKRNQPCAINLHQILIREYWFLLISSRYQTIPKDHQTTYQVQCLRHNCRDWRQMKQ